MAKRDYYEVLGISRDADDKAIKSAYRKKAKLYHPDTNVGNAEAEEKFKEATEAYEVLSDPKKKKMYDQFGHAAFDQTGGGAGGSGYGHASSYGGFNAEDIFNSFFGGGGFGSGGGFGGGFGSGGGFGGGFNGGGFGSGSSTRTQQQSNRPRKGKDIETPLNISFEESIFGCEKRIRYQGMEKQLEVKVPAGIDEGENIRIAGKGGRGVNGGANGDLLLKVHILPKAGYDRKGKDIYTTASIPYTIAVFGGEAVVDTLKGSVRCNIAPGTQSGSKIRLRGKGIAPSNGSAAGDQYVTIQIKVPTYLSPMQEEKLRQFQELGGGF